MHPRPRKPKARAQPTRKTKSMPRQPPLRPALHPPKPCACACRLSARPARARPTCTTYTTRSSVATSSCSRTSIRCAPPTFCSSWVPFTPSCPSYCPRASDPTEPLPWPTSMRSRGEPSTVEVWACSLMLKARASGWSGTFSSTTRTDSLAMRFTKLSIRGR